MGAGARKAEAVPTTVAKVRNFMLGKEEEGAAPVWKGEGRVVGEGLVLRSNQKVGKEEQEGKAWVWEASDPRGRRKERRGEAEGFEAAHDFQVH